MEDQCNWQSSRCGSRPEGTAEWCQDRSGAGNRDAPRPDGGTLAPWKLSRVKEFMRVNLSGSITVTDLAALVELSKSHFTRSFRNSVGEPPGYYLRRWRVEQAQHLMLTTLGSLAEIALECGFADQAHLTRCFGLMVGMSPSAWRRLHRTNTG